MSTQQPDIRSIPIVALVFSQTPVQIQRRSHFDKAALKELGETIKADGRPQQLITVRPILEVDEEKFEVADGERRCLAAATVGLSEILCEVRDLTDDQVLDIQIVTGLQKEGLHELVEAEGYETLSKRGMSAEEIADKVGKSKAYIYARMKLLALTLEARAAFYDGKISASVALVVARIPGEEQQLRALKQITDGGYHGDRFMTYREVMSYVHDTFMLKLSSAPFPRDDETLVPSAGTCGACPMRTGNQPELFGDVKGADVCTNPPCFAAKKAAHIKRELEKAKNAGERVIRGGDARRILPDKRVYWGSDGAEKHLRNGFARPADKCLDDPKKRTYAELAGKDAPRVLLQNPDTGRVEKVFELAAIADKLKDKGIKVKPPAKDRAEQQEQDSERREQEDEIKVAGRRAIFQAIMKAAPTTLSHLDLATLISKSLCSGYGTDEVVYTTLGWDTPKAAKKGRGGADSERLFLKRLLDCTDGELAQLAVAVTVIHEVEDEYREKGLETLAQRFRIDTKKILAELAPAVPKEEKPAPAKASKKPARKK